MRVVAAGPACALVLVVAIAVVVVVVEVAQKLSYKRDRAHNDSNVLVLLFSDGSQCGGRTQLGGESVLFEIGRHDAGM